MKKILIAGATGTAGQSHVANFIKEGYEVSGLSHKPESEKKLKALGCIPVFADLTKREETNKLLSKIKPEIVISSVIGHGEDAKQQEWQMGLNLIGSSHLNNVKTFIYLSVYRSDQNTGVPHFDVKAEIEEDLKNSSMDYLIIRPATFMDGLLSSWFLQSVIEKNTIVSPLDKDIRVSYLHPNDIARTILFCLDSNLKNETFTIGGNALSLVQIQQILSELKKQQVSYQQMPLEQVRQHAGSDIATMIEYFNRNGFEVAKNVLPKDYAPDFIKFEQIVNQYLNN